jgi:AcrR family transcriptional regulator
MTELLSAREANSLKVRNALMNACSLLLAEKPIDALTINEIVEKAGVAKGSFYNHFSDKESLAAAVSESIRIEVETTVEKSNENVTDPAYKIARGMCNFIQFTVAEPQRAVIMLRGFEKLTSSSHPLNQSLQQHISEGISTGRFQPRCDVAGMIQMMGCVYFSALRILDQKLSPAEAIDLSSKVFALLLCGFGLEEPEARRIAGDSARDIILGIGAYRNSS